MKARKLICFFLTVFVIFLSACKDNSGNIEYILNKYEKDDRYVIVYLDEILRFNDHEFDIKDFETNLKFSSSYYFIDSSLVYFYGSKNVGDKLIVKLFSCDHYGQKLSTIFEKSYKKDCLSEEDCALHGYNFYIKHHSEKKEEMNSYVLDVYNIENGEYKTILSGKEAYNFQVKINMYKPPNGEVSVHINQEMIDQTEIAIKLKESGYKMLFLDACYRNNEIYAVCHVYTISRYFKVFFKYNEQIERLEFITWTFGGVDPSAILKIGS